MPRSLSLKTKELGTLPLYLIYQTGDKYEDQWAPLQGCQITEGFTVISKTVLNQALLGWTSPLVKMLGIPPAGALVKLSVLNKLCEARESCPMYTKNECVPQYKKMPWCFQPAGLESDAQRRLAAEVVGHWRAKTFVVVVTDPLRKRTPLPDEQNDLDLDLNDDPSPDPSEDEDLQKILADVPIRVPAAPPKPADDDEGDDLSSFMAASGVQQEKTVSYKRRPWMDLHKFNLIKTIDELRALIDEAITKGFCSLDLETQGLDRRIYNRTPEEMKPEDYAEIDPSFWTKEWAHKGKAPATVHKIVGYCISTDGVTGHYIPIRHTAEGSSNIGTAEAAAEIRRLCLASQPELTPEGFAEDPLGSRSIAKPGIQICFWNAKFDQEFLYPITGLEFWHPDSFMDGMLLYFCKYTGDKNLGLKWKSMTELKTPKGDPYEMIELKELFVSSSGRKREIAFATLHPEEAYEYGASDSICTYLLCKKKENQDLLRDTTNPKSIAITSFTRLEKQVVQANRAMERPRIKIDLEYVKKLTQEAIQEAAQYEKEIVEMAASVNYHNLDVRGSKQLSEFLFTDRGLNIEPKPEVNEKSGQYKTDAETLEKLVEENPATVNPVLKTIVKFRQIDKVVGTYLENMLNNCDATGEIAYQFKATGAATARFSAPAGQPEHGFSGVPIHGIPGTYDDKKPKVATSLRSSFVAREGYIMAKVDFAGEELRIATNVSGEPVWIEEFTNGSGDLHTITAKAFFNKEEITKQERQMGKCVHPDTLLFLNGAYQPIKSAGQFKEPEAFGEATGTVETGSGPVSLTATFNGGVKPLFHVVTRDGVLTCTANHRLMLASGELRRAGDLLPGDLVETGTLPELGEGTYPSMSFPLWEGIPSGTYSFTHAHAYFAGLFQGDGCSSASGVSLSHGAVDKEDFSGRLYQQWQDTLVSSCREIGLNPVPRDVSVYLGSRVLVKYLQQIELMGATLKTLRMPSWVLQAGRSSVLHFLGGLLDTDGCVSKGAALELTTKDFVFAGQLSTAMRACGLEFSTELTFNKTYNRYYLRFRFTIDSSFQLAPFMKHTGKVERLRAAVLPGRREKGNAVIQVLPAGEGSCLDISVGSELHLYQANGFVTHNTSNFALLYGGGAASIVRATGCNQVEAQRRKANFDKALPQFAKWTRNQKALCHKEKGVWTAFRRWIAVPEIDSAEKYIVGSAERGSVNYPIQGTGADIMKIAMVLLHKEFYKRGWLPSQWDKVRMLLTVHDEIVFEIAYDVVVEAMDVIVELMEKPGYMAKWRIPLIAEPLIDTNWDAKYDWHLIHKGRDPKEIKKFKDSEHVMWEGKVYGRLPSFLVGHVKQPWDHAGQTVPDAPKEAAAPPTQSAPAPSPVAAQAQVPAFKPSVPASPKAKEEKMTFRISHLTGNSARQMMVCIAGSAQTTGPVLEVLYAGSGEVLVSSELGLRVDPEEFQRKLDEYNLLSNGTCRWPPKKTTFLTATSTTSPSRTSNRRSASAARSPNALGASMGGRSSIVGSTLGRTVSSRTCRSFRRMTLGTSRSWVQTSKRSIRPVERSLSALLRGSTPGTSRARRRRLLLRPLLLLL